MEAPSPQKRELLQRFLQLFRTIQAVLTNARRGFPDEPASRRGTDAKVEPATETQMEVSMLRRSNLVRASLAACALSLALSSTSRAAPLTINVHVPTPVFHAPAPTGVRDPMHFSNPSSGNNPRGSGDDLGGHGDAPASGNTVFRDSRRWGQKSPGGGQPGEPWNR